MIRFLTTVLTLAEKDVRIELRSKEMLYATFLFVMLCLVIFNFSFSINPQIVEKVAPGIIWVVVVFSGSISMNYLAHRDQEDHAHEGLLLAGCTGTALYFAKFVTTLVFMLVIQLLTIPFFILFFNFAVGDWLPAFASVLALGTIGYAAVGTLFASLLTHARLKELLLPVVFYPVVIPLLIAAVKATGEVFAGVTPKEIPLMVGFDLIFLTASALLFDFVVEDPS
ncbi:MAG TPA: heme exporter protein CcmB [Bdellovibrionota bacterium]|nr:heme exporter protein CcmB [Bdellovibrionota bacterium]